MTDTTQDEEKIESFVVRNANYYRDRWQKFQDKPGSVLSFNLAACLGQIIWLVYRKLYVPLVWAVVILIADVALWIYVDDRQLLSEGLSTAWSWIVAVLLFAVFGFLGNYWYWRKFQKVERQAAARYSERVERLQVLRSRGGTSPIGAWLVVIILLLPIVWAGYWGVYQASRIDYSAFVFDATGPLTLDEIEANFLRLMDEPLSEEKRECVYGELEDRARAAGDPETLDPATVELLPAGEWDRLDPYGKRLILTQAITTKAFFTCNRPGGRTVGEGVTNTNAANAQAVIRAGDPRFDVFELANSAGDGTFASPHGTVLLSFLARDSRYCRAARFSSDYTVVLACRNDDGWQIQATSSLAPGESTTTTVFGGGDMTAVTEAIRALQSTADLLDEREMIDAANRGWR